MFTSSIEIVTLKINSKLVEKYNLMGDGEFQLDYSIDNEGMYIDDIIPLSIWNKAKDEMLDNTDMIQDIIAHGLSYKEMEEKIFEDAEEKRL